MAYRRVFLILLDGMGVGGAPDAARFGDTDSDTLGHLAAATTLHCPTLQRLGLGNLYPAGLSGIPRTDAASADHCRLTELSAGKDTTTGHWELMGIVRAQPAPTFPQGFPIELIDRLKAASGRGVLANHPASGTQVIAAYGAEHLRGGDLIVYTSADSVLQIAAHVDVVPLPELYRICELVREIAAGEYAVDRVIARPFSGDPEHGFVRTPDRRDYSLPPPGPTYLDVIAGAARDVIGVGKISDIFAGQGITANYPVHGNAELMAKTAELAARDFHGLLFVNLVDFDMLFGHRNDPQGMSGALMQFDSWLEEFLNRCNVCGPARGETPSDVVIITADHGNDPTTASTDHSREQVPALICSQQITARGGQALTPAPGFYHLGATVAAALGVASDLPGQSLLR